MDKNKRDHVKNPRENANVFSIITFSWLFKTFIHGYKREFQENDLYSAFTEHKSSTLGDQIVKEWNQEVQKCKKKNDGSQPSLLLIYIRCFGRSIILIGLVQALMEFVISISVPLVLAELLRSLKVRKQDRGDEAYYYSGLFVLLLILQCIISHCTLQGTKHIGMKVRVATCTLIYRKILKLSSCVLESDTSVGQMVNFLSSDVNRLDYAVDDINYMWIAPTQAVIVGYILLYKFGWTAIFGSLTYILFLPIQMYLGTKVSQFTLQSAQRTDKRLCLMNEVIGGVQIIKMYVWEAPFSYLVEKARRKEINVIKKTSVIETLATTMDLYLPRVALFIVLITYVSTENFIEAEKVYMLTAFCNILKNTMTLSFPHCVTFAFEGLASMKRIRKFLLRDEISISEQALDQSKSLSICMRNATARWDKNVKDDTLSDVNLAIEPGSLVAIIGQVGSGKSSLVQAILRELPLTSGSLETSGKISYAGQRPWMFASSVRQNIIFGQPLDRARYDRVIEVCQLKTDLTMLPHGDSTIVGERGINVSGGQRARINLARAIYCDADIYLLDDPLSAVDAHVGKRIMDECIRDYLKGKTTVLVTHQLQYLKSTDHVVVMNNGSIEIQGTLDEVRASETIFSKLLKKTDDTQDKTGPVCVRKEGNRHTIEGENRDESLKQCSAPEMAETKSHGRLSWKVYLSYIQASRSPTLVFLVALLIFFYEVSGSGSDYFISYWVSIEEKSFSKTENGTTVFKWQGPLPRDVIIYLYSGLILLMVLTCVLMIVLFFEVCMRCSRNLHAMMFRSIIRATMYFFNTNPMGRILNRVSKDMSAIDTKVVICIFDVIVCFGTVAAIIIVIGVVNPWLLIPLTGFIGLLCVLRAFYVPLTQNIKRLEGITRSVVFDHVGATLQGLVTIRALKAEEILTREFDNHQDVHSSAWFIFISASRTFGLYVETLCMICVGVMIVIFLEFEDTLAVGDVGLVITQTISLAMMIQWGLRQLAELDNQMTSVERVLEYSQLEEEPSLDSDPGKKPPAEWPTHGRLEFRDVKLRYSPNDECVLKDVRFTVMPKEKVGIVGRTGAGKTSLIGALFRLADVQGDILIDGVSTGSIGLHDFRSKISIIPQEPILFAGSLRKNLDPFEEYSDNVLWQALEDVELKGVVEEMAAGLNTRVYEGGVNFSVGQRQLLCLARAVVRNNKIMVLDEATANVDHQTDALIQKTVRRKFKDCTVLTIAHRLNTVMDSDKILVVDAGRLVEFDHPYVLLKKEGYFYNMVEQTGSSMAAALSEIAENSFYEKFIEERSNAPSR